LDSSDDEDKKKHIAKSREIHKKIIRKVQMDDEDDVIVSTKKVSPKLEEKKT